MRYRYVMVRLGRQDEYITIGEVDEPLKMSCFYWPIICVNIVLYVFFVFLFCSCKSMPLRELNSANSLIKNTKYA